LERAGESCARGYACEGGECELQCSEGHLACDGSCINPETDDAYCGATGDCNGDGAGQSCDGESKCIRGKCRFPTGAECGSDEDCIGGICSKFYEDSDGDGFGAESTDVIFVCGEEAPGPQWVTNNEDCCDIADDPDVAAAVNPDYAGGDTIDAAGGCPEPYDWNCDGLVSHNVLIGSACANFTSQVTCPSMVFVESSVACGEKGIMSACFWLDGSCQITTGTELPLACQ
jgi:hypothetical protein